MKKYIITAENVAVIVLNYNNANDTICCIKSLFGLNNLPGAIVIVDNNSNKDDIKKIRYYIKEKLDSINKVYFLQLNSNDGYAKGNNLGIQFIQKNKNIKAYWILNNDTIVDSISLDTLCARMNKEDKASIIGSTIIHMRDMSTLQCAAGYYSKLKITFDKPILSGEKKSNLSEINTRSVEKKISYIIGASFFLHADILEKIGYFKEDFFLYAEEMEYCIRAKKQNIPLLWEKSSMVYHKGGGTTQSSSSTYEFPKWVDYLMIRNRTRTIGIHYPLLLPIYWLCSFGIICKRILLRKPVRPILIYRAMWDGTIGKMGKPKIFGEC